MTGYQGMGWGYGVCRHGRLRRTHEVGPAILDRMGKWAMEKGRMGLYELCRGYGCLQGVCAGVERTGFVARLGAGRSFIIDMLDGFL